MMVHGYVALGTDGISSTAHGRMGRAWGRMVEGIQNGLPSRTRESHDDVAQIHIICFISFYGEYSDY